VLFEKILKIVFSGIEGKISYVEFHVVVILEQLLPATSRSRESGFKSPKSQTQLTIYQAKKRTDLIQWPEHSSFFAKTQPVIWARESRLRGSGMTGP
jgi:hypothetical protein